MGEGPRFWILTIGIPAVGCVPLVIAGFMGLLPFPANLAAGALVGSVGVTLGIWIDAAITKRKAREEAGGDG